MSKIPALRTGKKCRQCGCELRCPRCERKHIGSRTSAAKKAAARQNSLKGGEATRKRWAEKKENDDG